MPLRRLADRAEQVIAASLYVWLCLRLLPHTFPPEHFYPLMVLLSEGMVLLFLLIRRRTDKISVNARDWIVAFGGTIAPLLVVNSETAFLPQAGRIYYRTGTTGDGAPGKRDEIRVGDPNQVPNMFPATPRRSGRW